MKNVTTKIAGIALAGLVVAGLVGCGGVPTSPDGSGNVGSALVNVSEKDGKTDAGLNTFGMSFTAPNEYATVETTYNRDANGTVTDKNVIYTLEDGTIIDFSGAVLKDGENAVALIQENIAEENLEIVPLDGFDFYVFELGGDRYAVAQDEQQRAYGLSVERESSESATDVNALFQNMMNGIHIKAVSSMDGEDIDLGTIQVKVNDAWKLVQTYESVKMNKNGNILNTSRVWKFGESPDKLDFRFRVQCFQKTNIDDVLDAEKEYQDVEINGVTYKALSTDDGIIEYTIQQGVNTYSIRNMGENNSGWFTNRSEESMKAFEEFMNSISFEEEATK